MNADVLIAGAGPTGLTLACGLLANGISTRVVDKAVAPAVTSRALGLQPRGIEVVERLGALDGLSERALQVEQIVVHINGKQAASVRVGQRTALVTRPGLVISQAEVEAELRRRVTELGGQIEWGREVVAADQDASRHHRRPRRRWRTAGSAGSSGATARTAACANWPASGSPGSRSPSASARRRPCRPPTVTAFDLRVAGRRQRVRGLSAAGTGPVAADGAGRRPGKRGRRTRRPSSPKWRACWGNGPGAIQHGSVIPSG